MDRGTKAANDHAKRISERVAPLVAWARTLGECRRGGALVLVLLLPCASAMSCASEAPSIQVAMERGENAGEDAERALNEADHMMDALDAKGAEKKLDAARKSLSNPDIGKYPEHALLAERLQTDEKRLENVQREIAQRELARRIAEQKQGLEEERARLAKAIEAIQGPSATKREVEQAKDAIDAIGKVLDDATELEAKDADFSTYVSSLRKALAKSRDTLKLWSRVIAFKEGPDRARAEGLELTAQVKAERDEKKKRELRGAAIAKLQTCVLDGKELIGNAPEAAKLKLEVDGKPTTIDAVIASCQHNMDSLVKKQKQKPAPDDARPALARKTASKKKSAKRR